MKIYESSFGVLVSIYCTIVFLKVCQTSRICENSKEINNNPNSTENNTILQQDFILDCD